MLLLDLLQPTIGIFKLNFHFQCNVIDFVLERMAFSVNFIDISMAKSLI